MLDILQRAPIREFNLLKALLRRRYGTVDWPDRPTTTLAIDAETLEAQLRRHHFEDVAGWSLKYRGEVCNLRRPADVDGDGGTPLETHLRARESDAGLEINGHLEPCRWESTVEHVDSERLEWLDEGDLSALLEGCGLDVGALEA